MFVCVCVCVNKLKDRELKKVWGKKRYLFFYCIDSEKLTVTIRRELCLWAVET